MPGVPRQRIQRRVMPQRALASKVLGVEHLEPAPLISTIASARLGIHPPGKTCLRMKSSVSKPCRLSQ
jgi:hypothetical protein